MPNYLTEGWPLGPTSTVYMDGTALFVVHEYGKPGIRATVAMTPAQAQIIRDIVDQRVSDEYEAGHDAGYETGYEHAQTHA